MKSLMISILTEYCSGEQIEKNEMMGYIAPTGRGNVYTGIWCGILRERDILQNRGDNTRVITR